MRLHLFGHNSKNNVKVGDKVKAYDEYIGEIGNADGKYYSHLHYSVSDDLVPSQLRSYIVGWSLEKVKQYYREPDIQNALMFEKPVDNGDAGYDWLQSIGNGFHPGRDYNGFGGGDTDYGYKFKSPVDGKVVVAGDWGSGWGKILIIEEEEMSEKTYYIKSDLRNELKKIWEDFDHEEKDDHEEMAEKLEDYIKDLRIENIALSEGSEKQSETINDLDFELNDLKEENTKLEKSYNKLTAEKEAIIVAQEKLTVAHDKEIAKLNKYIKELKVYAPKEKNVTDLSYNWNRLKHYASKIWELLINKK